jgi:hypothetical protein
MRPLPSCPVAVRVLDGSHLPERAVGVMRRAAPRVGHSHEVAVIVVSVRRRVAQTVGDGFRVVREIGRAEADRIVQTARYARGRPLAS